MILLRLAIVGVLLAWSTAPLFAQASDEGWAVRSQDDKFDGRMTAVISARDQQGSQIGIFYLHKCPQNANCELLQYSISVFVRQPFSCPIVEKSTIPQIEDKYFVSARWFIDSGPIHKQKFKHVSNEHISYNWLLEGIDSQATHPSYRNLAEFYGFDRLDPLFARTKGQLIIPPQQMIALLAKGTTFELRLNDRCTNSDLTVDLRGLASALKRASIPLPDPRKR
jgi:hypothetical protein